MHQPQHPLHHVRRALGHGFCSIQEDFSVAYMTEADSSGGLLTFLSP